MLTRLLLFFCLLNLARAQDGCEEFWQLANDENGDVYGIVSLPPTQTNEHKLTIKLSIARDVSSVSSKIFFVLCAYLTSLICHRQTGINVQPQRKKIGSCLCYRNPNRDDTWVVRTMLCVVGHARSSLDEICVVDPTEDDNEYI